MFLMVVNQGNSVIGLVDAINGHPRLAVLSRRALENDVVDCFLSGLRRCSIGWYLKSKDDPE
jgi:hypothetical protein